MLRGFFASELSLNCERNGVPAAQAERGHTLVPVPTNEFMDERDQHPRAACPDRMPDRHCSAIDVEDLT